MSELQADSLERIARYKRLRDEAEQSGNTTMIKAWSREISNEQKLLKVIIRVEKINATGELEGYMEHFRMKLCSKDLIAV